MVVDIRTATPADVPGIRQVADRTWRATYGDILHHDTIEAVLADWYDPDRLQEAVADRGFLVAVRDGAIAGFTHVTVDGDTATLHRIYVDPDVQDEGIGSALLDRATAIARDRDAETVRAEVLAANDAGRAFYAARGFTVLRTEQTVLDDQTVDQVVMERSP